MDLRDTVAASLLPLRACRCVIERFRTKAAEISLEALLHFLDETDVAGRARVLRESAAGLIDRARTCGIDTVPFADFRYPHVLAEIFDPPLVLWVQGQVEALTRPAVAIVGSRAASPYALEIAHQLAADLGRRGVTVVSGLARGVDAAAHRGALDGDGETIAVLGSGVDLIYPAEHRSLAGAIGAHGAIVSELPPGSPPLAQHFPRRNRIISGLSLAVVVVEASEKSGSLITANCALEQGREVMAVPGNALSGRNRGSHALLKDGAKIVEGVDDILGELRSLRWETRPNASVEERGGEEPAGPHSGRSEWVGEDPVLQHMTAGDAYDLDALAQVSGIDAVKLLPRLLELELSGAVHRVDGGRFMRTRRSRSGDGNPSETGRQRRTC